ncbi:uncharacterized protein LOC129588772 [Paramacrobiotus metropolitanus]|uniref:uncharacterized protein LOC129588772 n=1 Tax=Paramacrobiotus metropolitanus TaxID=2943436 RepID=UPI002445D018|nr:uncharacterized protein LOC129588772 [Paramacrobiotus metropolitanus]
MDADPPMESLVSDDESLPSPVAHPDPQEDRLREDEAIVQKELDCTDGTAVSDTRAGDDATTPQRDSPASALGDAVEHGDDGDRDDTRSPAQSLLSDPADCDMPVEDMEAERVMAQEPDCSDGGVDRDDITPMDSIAPESPRDDANPDSAAPSPMAEASVLAESASPSDAAAVEPADLRCIISSCRQYNRPHPDVYPFPPAATRAPQRLTWIRAINASPIRNRTVTSAYLDHDPLAGVCPQHFRPEEQLWDGTLQADALPTVFEGRPGYWVDCVGTQCAVAGCPLTELHLTNGLLPLRRPAAPARLHSPPRRFQVQPPAGFLRGPTSATLIDKTHDEFRSEEGRVTKKKKKPPLKLILRKSPPSPPPVVVRRPKAPPLTDEEEEEFAAMLREAQGELLILHKELDDAEDALLTEQGKVQHLQGRVAAWMQLHYKRQAEETERLQTLDRLAEFYLRQLRSAEYEKSQLLEQLDKLRPEWVKAKTAVEAQKTRLAVLQTKQAARLEQALQNKTKKERANMTTLAGVRRELAASIRANQRQRRAYTQSLTSLGVPLPAEINALAEAGTVNRLACATPHKLSVPPTPLPVAVPLATPYPPATALLNPVHSGRKRPGEAGAVVNPPVAKRRSYTRRGKKSSGN